VIDKSTTVRHVFVDEYKELSFKKVIDVQEFSGRLLDAGF